MKIEQDLLTQILCDAVLAGGVEIMDIYSRADDVQIQQKGDGSPLTNADLAANAVIVKTLQTAFPDIPIISEEGDISSEVPEKISGMFFLVDPLDGTKEFINRNGEFTVNIALIENGKPIHGAIYVPAQQKLYFTKGNEAYLKIGGEPAKLIQSRTADRARIKAVISRSHMDKKTEIFLQKFPDMQIIATGSSLKICLLAEGQADLYPRFGRTMEWDIAAGHAILHKAGGVLTHIDGSEFLYGKKDYANDDGFIAYGDFAEILH